MTVSNAGTSEYNGDWEQREEYFGRPRYYKVGGTGRQMLWYAPGTGEWCMGAAGVVRYLARCPALYLARCPPTEGWEVTSDGSAPAPRLRYAERGGGGRGGRAWC